MQLGDAFPIEERRKHIQARLTPGRVLFLHCNFTIPPKNKFLLLASVEPEPLFFVINSTVNEYIRKREWLFRGQIKIGHEEHSLLQHHSFIDCTTAHKIPLCDVYEQVEADSGRLKGEISPHVRKQIVGAVRIAKTLSPRQKSTILSALGRGS